MIIKAKLKKTLDGTGTECILITYDDHPRVWSVPLDSGNADYQEYLKWTKGEYPYTEKGTPEAAD
mgnify:CR=1 FL=1